MLQPWWRRLFGTRSERTAARFLRAKGMRILHQNWSCRLGELDIVCLDGPVLVFVEVRSTAKPETDSPAQSVDQFKQRRLTNLALHYMSYHRMLNTPARFDVLAMSWPDGQAQPLINYIPNAFEAVGRNQTFS